MALWTEALPTVPLVLTIEALPYLATGLKTQHVTLYGNGYYLGSWSLGQNKVYALQAVIEPEQWLNRDGGGLLKAVWQLADSTKPSDIGDAQDHRQLALCFRKLSLDTKLSHS